MTTAKDILDAVNRLLVAKWPNRLVYRDAVPNDFNRPSFLLEVTKENRRPANIGMMRVTSYFLITAFENVDEYHRMDASQLLDTQIAVMEFFDGGKLAVGDRHIDITASFGGNNDGEAYVDLQCNYLDARQLAAETTTLIGSAKINLNLEE